MPDKWPDPRDTGFMVSSRNRKWIREGIDSVKNKNVTDMPKNGWNQIGEFPSTCHEQRSSDRDPTDASPQITIVYMMMSQVPRLLDSSTG